MTFGVVDFGHFAWHLFGIYRACDLYRHTLNTASHERTEKKTYQYLVQAIIVHNLRRINQLE